MNSLERSMAALYLRLTLAILISVRRRRRRRQKILTKKRLSNRKIWVGSTIAGRSTAGGFQSTFLVAIPLVVFSLPFLLLKNWIV